MLYNDLITVNDKWRSITVNELKWRSRRGMKELDRLFMAFLANKYGELSQQDQALYCELLEEQDQDLFRWLVNHDNPPSKFINIIPQIIKSYNNYS